MKQRQPDIPAGSKERQLDRWRAELEQLTRHSRGGSVSGWTRIPHGSASSCPRGLHAHVTKLISITTCDMSAGKAIILIMSIFD
jgi:hypothetical protein